jgi:15-cis-phytoene synthase
VLSNSTALVSAPVDFAALMRRRGKSFYLASLVLPRVVAQRAMALYAFCRQVDDIADGDAPLGTKHAQLSALLNRLTETVTVPSQNTVAPMPHFEAVFETSAAADLVRASLADAQHWPINTQADLLDFCYGVAGTVGVMMCPVLGAETVSSQARNYAANLGIAMQLTNIARDVLEDAAMQRCYIPQTWLQTPTDFHARLCGGDAVNTRAATFKAVLQLIELADEYYRRAEPGFVFIPWRARYAIFVAARVYRAIGVKIARSAADGGTRYWQARTVVSSWGKALAIADASARFVRSLVWRAK